jgi:dTDP-4-dehydrorhamnose reductase
MILGARGMLATDLAATAPAGVHVEAFSRSELDITDTGSVERVVASVRPDWVLNGSAYTQVDRAEADVERAMEVNGDAVGRLGDVCMRHGAAVGHFSTDYVFSGNATRPYRETDPVDPVNAYGRSKLAGEQALLASGARALVLRTQWLYGVTGKSFPRTMWERARQRMPTRVVADQFGRPTSTIDLARAVWQLVGRDVTGLYHIANTGEPATWFDIASAAFARADALSVLSACSTVDYPTPARRPAYSVMDGAKLLRDTGIALPPWRDALARFLEILAGQGASALVGGEPR